VEDSAENTIIHAWQEEQVRMIATRKGPGADKIEKDKLLQLSVYHSF